MVSDFTDPAEPSSPCCGGSSSASGRPLSFSLLQSPRDPSSGASCSDQMSDAKAAGLQIRAQVATRPVGVLLGLELTAEPVQHLPDLSRDRRTCRWPSGWRACATRVPRPPAGRRAGQRPRARPVAGAGLGPHLSDGRRQPGLRADARPTRSPPSPSARGADPREVALDHMLDGGEGRARMLYLPLLNYAAGQPRPGLRDAAARLRGAGPLRRRRARRHDLRRQLPDHQHRPLDARPHARAEAAARAHGQGPVPRHRRDGRPLDRGAARSRATAPTSTSSTTTA